ncbi:hypothetical protein PWR66_04710 [Paraburkholderia sp. A1RO-5]|uniref:HVO_A0114 family putative DNA-binding protein n=1 Tax=Paraburkholderia sp. A1RO-5 TaxID=3028369 RepID=UPI003B760D49
MRPPRCQHNAECRVRVYFARAFDRAAAGEDIEERPVTFMSFEEMTAALTPRRIELLRYLHREEAESVMALVRALKRDYKRVHEDVATVGAAGLIVREGGRLRAPWDTLSAELTL